MNKKESLLTIIKMFKLISEAFPAMKLHEEPWGVMFEQTEGNSLSMALASDQFTVSDFKKFADAFNTPAVWYFLPMVNQPKQFTKVKELNIFHRPYAYIEKPDPTGFLIDSFSFNIRKRDVHTLFTNIDFLPEYLGIPKNRSKSFEKIPRGFLHVVESAKLWALTDYDNKPISFALSMRENGVGLILFLCTVKQLRSQGFATTLLKGILSSFPRNTETLLVMEESGLNLVKELNFSLLYNFDGLEKENLDLRETD